MTITKAFFFTAAIQPVIYGTQDTPSVNTDNEITTIIMQSLFPINDLVKEVLHQIKAITLKQLPSTRETHSENHL